MKKILLTLIILLLELSQAWANSSPNIPIDDPVYQQIDQIVAWGLVKDVIYGQRPWSRYEIARIISIAKKNIEAMEPPPTTDDNEIGERIASQEMVVRLEKRFHEELDQIAGTGKNIWIHPIEEAHWDYTFLSSPYRNVPDNGLGSVDSRINPLVAYQEGRHIADGVTVSLETAHAAQLSPYFSLYFRPRLEALTPSIGSNDANFVVQQLYGKFTFHNVELEAGRDSIIWGQGEYGGILLSNNARPLDTLKISNPSPTTLPWIFKYLGRFRYTLFVANMGPDREYPYSFLTGAKFSLKPASFFEMGISQIVMMGGQGAPGPLSFGNTLQEFVGFRPGDINQINLSNREAGLDFRFFIPQWRNTQLYLEIQFEDNSSNSAFQFKHLASYHSGIYFPLLSADGTLGLRMEYRHISPFFYRHGGFVTGMTLNQNILGDPLGPDGNGVYLTLDYRPSDSFQLSSIFQYERRGSDILHQTGDGMDRHLVLDTAQPAEHRFQCSFRNRYALTPSWFFLTELGYERVQSFNFVTGDHENNLLLKAGLQWTIF